MKSLLLITCCCCFIYGTIEDDLKIACETLHDLTKTDLSMPIELMALSDMIALEFQLPEDFSLTPKQMTDMYHNNKKNGQYNT